MVLKDPIQVRQWRHTLLIPAQRQVNLLELRVSLVYMVRSRTVRAIQQKPVSKINKTKPKKTQICSMS